jgi:3-deoxy-D-manno-octulosonic-acid transferase
MLFDLAYALLLMLLFPWLLWRSLATGRYRRELAAKLLGRVTVTNPHRKPVAWFHAVSVGEVNLLATLVPAFRARHPEYLVVVSSTTDTGLAEARRRFADSAVIAWPFDFSWAVASALDSVKPSLVVLAESELWPNFLDSAKQRRVPVVVMNARMSPRSFRRATLFAGLVRRLLFSKIARFAVQEQEYAERLRALGARAEQLTVTGSIKYDGAIVNTADKSRALGRLLGSGNGSLILLAGSTHSPEESLILTAFARLRTRFPQLRLILVPRHPDRFEEVAELVRKSGLPFTRRSEVEAALPEMPAVVLLDTMGELGAAWGLADVGFTGGSLDGKRGGQSMIEPAGHGVPCVFGPHVWNFRDAARRLVEVGGAVMVPDAAALESALAELIANTALRQRMGEAARQLVLLQQGATNRTLDAIDGVLKPTMLSRAA